MRIQDLTNNAKVIDHEPTDGFWFQHESPHKLSEIKVLTYEELEKVRDTTYPLSHRIKVEDEYRRLTGTPDNTTFIYATPVKYNMFGDPNEYPGYTYYFKLTNAEVDRSVFEIIDKAVWMNPTLGRRGLMKAIQLYKKNKSKFVTYNDPDIGMIYPRIEVAIPFNIKPSLVIPQEEDR
jgi:hypothetical protein